MKNILFAASECVPFIKTGGLADVVGSLPKYFDKKKYDVRVVLPKYSCMNQKWKDQLEYMDHFYMNLAGEDRYVGILKYVQDGITFYFIDNEYYFNGFAPYDGDPRWNIEKFAFFSKAVLSILPVIDFRPELIHCHDWQTGLIPVYLDNFRFLGEYYRGIKSVMTIHNLKFQGVWDTSTVRQITGLPEYYFAPDKLEAYRDANLLKGGIVYADKVTTVSQTYAQEIKTPFFGEGLDGLMSARSNDLCGIVNGLDYDEYCPFKDTRIAKRFTADTFRKNKVSNKLSLQEIDEMKLTLAISNLVENAIKYNRDEGWVRVSLNADHKYFYVKVMDSGIGIPEEDQAHIFERFYRVDKSHSREIGGTGLGLAIARNAVIMHRGSIKVYSSKGEGTTFTVRIPLTYAA